MRLKYIIIRKTEDLPSKKEEDKSSVSSELNKEFKHSESEEKREIKNEESVEHKENTNKIPNYYNLYIIKNSKHFTVSLAKWILKQLNKDIEFLELSEIKTIFENSNLNKPNKNTWGDILLLVNSYYLNTVVNNKIIVKIEQLKRTYNSIIDSDKSFDTIFDKWILELKNRDIEIPWKDFI